MIKNYPRCKIFLAAIALLPFFYSDVTASLIDEIVVTASKNESSKLTTQGNIASINAEEIKFLGAHNPGEIINRLPGIYISQGSGQEHLTSIRSPVLSGGAGAGSFLFLEDGIPLRSPGFGNVNGLMESIIEIGERTEVVRGPGSTLYGSNAIHGLMNVITPAPSDNKNGSIGTHFSKSEFILDGRYSQPTENGGVIASFYWREDNGHSHNHEDGEETDQPHYGQQKFLFRWDHSKNLTDYIFTLTGTNLNQETMGYVKGFEVYKDYMDMKKKIIQYTAPDLSGINEELAVLDKKMDGVQTSVAEGVDYTRDIKNDLKKDIGRIEKQVDSVEQRGKDAFALVRESIETNDTKVRKMVSDATDRFDKRREQTRNDMDAMETRNKSEMKNLKDEINNKIKKALENPLANMRK